MIMERKKKLAVVLLNLGGPDKLDAVEPFLYNLFNDADIIDFPLSFLFRKRLAKLISSKRAPKIQEQYKTIGGKSPILDITQKQAQLLEEKLNKHYDTKIFIAMRYWKPFTADAVKQISGDKFDEVVLLPLYPQYSYATTGSSYNEWNRCIKKSGLNSSLKAVLINNYHLHPLYIQSFIERIDESLNKFPAEKREHVFILFSAHGTPLKLVKKGDPYSFQIKETVQETIKQWNIRNNYMLSFQSKVGPQKWLTPATSDTIINLAKDGLKEILMVPVAFTSDHLETLFEINREYRHLAKENGITSFEMTEGLNDSAMFISALEDIVIEKIKNKNIRSNK